MSDKDTAIVGIYIVGSYIANIWAMRRLIDIYHVPMASYEDAVLTFTLWLASPIAFPINLILILFGAASDAGYSFTNLVIRVFN